MNHIQNTIRAFFSKGSVQKALSEALRFEYSEAAYGPQCPKIATEVVRDFMYGSESFLGYVVTEWERANLQRTKSDRPRTVLARDLRVAFAVVLGDGALAGEELVRAEEKDPKELAKFFSSRAVRFNIQRKTTEIYDVADGAIVVMQQILWGRTLSLAKQLLCALPAKTKCVSRKIFRHALCQPRPHGWGVKLIGDCWA